MRIGTENVKRWGQLWLICFCALVAVLLWAGPEQVFAVNGPAIVGQPQNQEVNYPEEARFHVEAADPGSVATYEWFAVDESGEHRLDGTSATTDTLILPATDRSMSNLNFYCKITDRAGFSNTSQQASLTILNRAEEKMVLFVGDRAILPGEVLNLEEAGLGSGRITLEPDRINITFDHVLFQNQKMTFDRTLAPSQGISFVCPEPDSLEYYMHFLGECRLENTLYGRENEEGAITLEARFFCGEEKNKPLLILDGDGKTTVGGGYYQIYTDADLEIAANLTTNALGGNATCNGIHSAIFLVDEDVKLNLQVRGDGIAAEDDMRLFPGSVVSIESAAPHMGQRATSIAGILVCGSLYAEEASVSIRYTAQPENFLPYDQFLNHLCGISIDGAGDLNLNASDVSIELSAEEGEEPFLIRMSGILGDNRCALNMEGGSRLQIRTFVPQSREASGIRLGDSIRIEEDCSLTVDIAAQESAFGLDCARSIYLRDAAVAIRALAGAGKEAYGIVCEELEADYRERSKELHVLVSEGGVALAADTGERDIEIREYDPEYEATQLILSGRSKIAYPKKVGISRYSFHDIWEIRVSEVLFDLSGSEPVPAVEARITGSIHIAWIILSAIGAAAILGGAFYSVQRRRRREAGNQAEEEKEGGAE